MVPRAKTPGMHVRLNTAIARSVATATALLFGLLLSDGGHCFAAKPLDIPVSARDALQENCIDCHSGREAEARLDLQAMLAEPLEHNFAQWRNVVREVSEQRMPPEDSATMTADTRADLGNALSTAINATAQLHTSDPGPSVVRRLTSAEYDYSIEDLTGLQLRLGEQFVSDGVGGSGFTNSSAAQFMQDATLERYLEAAKRVADHAMLGTGPLYFFDDPGQTGLELSAADRIKKIYRRYGFRSSAGEGAEPYGLERFALAFEVAWRFRYRTQLLAMDQTSASANQDPTLESLAENVGVETKFAEHIWNVLNRNDATFPLSEIIAQWNALPEPSAVQGNLDQAIKQQTLELYAVLEKWQTRFAGTASAEEEAAVLTVRGVDVPDRIEFVARALRKRKVRSDNFTPDINNTRLYSDDGIVRFEISIEAASTSSDAASPVVIFRNPQFRYRVINVVQPEYQTLTSLLSSRQIDRLKFGENPGGEPVGPSDFALAVGQTAVIEVELPDGCNVGELRLDASLDKELGRDAVVRCVIEDKTSDRGRSFSSLLRDAESSSMDTWEAGLSDFARSMPQISNREPVPSDRDPIPLPYNNIYNLPERNYFHTAVKYYRDDSFLLEHIIPDAEIAELDRAWTDLLTSFDYHNVNLRFTADKYGIELGDRRIDAIDDEWLDGIAPEPRKYIAAFKAEYDAMQQELVSAQWRHLDDTINFAERAWRRPLSNQEIGSLRDFYWSSRQQTGLEHAAAIRTLLARILVSPNFLFRIEVAPPDSHDPLLDDYEIASRLSFSIWSSIPDQELLQLAQQGKLQDADELQRQVMRMLESAKARRLSTEFFGQWLGFYQFDRFRGVDVERFPEFDDELKQSLYDEAISLFEHIVREDRPYHEILDADYLILDQRSAQHYDLAWDEGGPQRRMLDAAGTRGRGGVFGLAAVLTSTSAPLRTSPVKRGDWILRRILGTPVPPPPADAGSIPAEDVLADGKTVRERLEVHRNKAECMNCHVRIDPLGFALENFDSLGRWRATYRDGQPIDASGTLHTGDGIRGMAGLKNYLRQSDPLFRRTFATMLVAYFLGRPESLSDVGLVDSITEKLHSDPRISTAIFEIVASPQFRRIRSAPTQSNSPTVLPVKENVP